MRSSPVGNTSVPRCMPLHWHNGLGSYLFTCCPTDPTSCGSGRLHQSSPRRPISTTAGSPRLPGLLGCMAVLGGALADITGSPKSAVDGYPVRLYLPLTSQRLRSTTKMTRRSRSKSLQLLSATPLPRKRRLMALPLLGARNRTPEVISPTCRGRTPAGLLTSRYCR